MNRELLKFILSQFGQDDNIHHRMMTLFLQTSNNPEVSFDDFENFLIKYKSSELLLTREELLTQNIQTKLTTDEQLFNQYIISTQISAAAPSEFQAMHPSEMNTPPTKRQRYTRDIALHSEFHEDGEVQIQQVHNTETSNPQKKRAHISGGQKIKFAYPSGNYSLFKDYKKGKVTPVKDDKKYEIKKNGSSAHKRRSYIERNGKEVEVITTNHARRKIKCNISCEQKIEFTDPSGNYSSYNDYKFKFKITPIEDKDIPYKIIREGSTRKGRRLYIVRNGIKERIVSTANATARLLAKAELLLAKGQLQLDHPCDSAPTHLPTNDLDTTASFTNSGVPDHQSFNYDDENKATMPPVENFLEDFDESPCPLFTEEYECLFDPLNESDDLPLGEDTAATPAEENLSSIPSELEPYPENIDDDALKDIFSYPLEEDTAGRSKTNRFFSDKPENPDIDKTTLRENTKGFK